MTTSTSIGPFRMLAALALAAVIFAISANSANSATTFVVNDLGDDGDGDLADSACDVAPIIAGDQCTLRAALQEANDTAGADTINFNIPGTGVRSIAPVSALPAATGPVTIDGETQPGFSGNPVIELDGSGVATPENGLTIAGGDSTVRGLVINRFGGQGIRLETGGSNTIEGNLIGTNAAGDTTMGNGRNGVEVVSSDNNTIEGNVIGDNGNAGIAIRFSNGNTVQKNIIGASPVDGTALGNDFGGVFLDNADNNTIGASMGPGGGNVIAFTRFGAGVTVGVGSDNNALLSNSIVGNFGLGIDLNNDDVTPNDPSDPDTGPNDLQNFPEITSARSSLRNTKIRGTLNSSPGASFIIQLFANPRSQSGEGKRLIGQLTVVTDATSGDAFFNFKVARRMKRQEVTATATSLSDSTSEFSAPRKVVMTR